MVRIESNIGGVLRQFEKEKMEVLEALGFGFTGFALEEMDRLIYDAPLPKSAENNPHYRRTGLMRRGQGYFVDGAAGEVVVGNDVDYAVHVHFEGVTRNWAGAPWMTNVINGKQRELESIISEKWG